MPEQFEAREFSTPPGRWYLTAATTDETDQTQQFLSEDAAKAIAALLNRPIPMATAIDTLQSYDKFDGVGPHNETIEVRASIGERFLECYESALDDPLLKGWTPADCPSEIVFDLLERLRSAHPPAALDARGGRHG